MPEIAEVARCVHFLRLHLLGKKIAKVSAQDDANVFGKAGTSGSAFEKAVKGKEVVSVGSQGKYFWITFDRPPHAVMHLGMTGWIHIRGDKTAYTNYYKKMKDREADIWPPKYWKFQIETEGNPAVQAAFTDPRRFGRVRLVDCPGDEIRAHSPLKENGPDPVVDAEVFTEDYLKHKMQSRHVPIKALLLDQTHISGIGNWVADEVLYQSRLHPEQYCDDFSEDEIRRLHGAIRYVCQTAVDKLGDSDEFPDDWLFNHRWGKGKTKGAASTLPNGEKLAFITVGGRTSCYAPARQKKTGRVAPSAKEEPLEGEEAKPRAGAGKKKRAAKSEVVSDGEKQPIKKSRGAKASAKQSSKVKEEEKPDASMAETPKKSRGSRTTEKTKAPTKAEKEEGKPTDITKPGRRRSLRLRK